MSKQQPKYSGEASTAFWKRINKINNQTTHDLVYVAGCALQDHENRVLQMLHLAELKT